MRQYRALKLRQKANEMVSDVYQVTMKFPDRERFNLVNSDKEFYIFFL